ncbi:hypothetical protein ACFQ0D_14555 [Micromonospora zhanjiangensis]
MTALDTTAFNAHADQRHAEARHVLDTHTTNTYTGLCDACGRPGPCDQRQSAEQTAAHYTRPDLPTPHTRPAEQAVTTAVCTIDDLRTTALAIQEAVDRAAGHLDGVHHLDRRLVDWRRALTDAWQALGLVHAGLADARRLPGTPGGTAADLLAGLRRARADADRATTLAATARLRLTVAEDQLRRTRNPAALIAARQWGAAIARLDLVAARLAIGGLAIDRYAAVIAGPHPALDPAAPTGRSGVDASLDPAPATVRSAVPAMNAIERGNAVGGGNAVESRSAAPAAAEGRCRVAVAAGAATAGKLIVRTRRRDHPSFWATVRHQLREETRR